jgi:hypothetical protein
MERGFITAFLPKRSLPAQSPDHAHDGKPVRLWPQNEVKSPPEFYSATRDQYLMRSIKLSLNWEFGELFQAGYWNAYYYTHAHHQFRDSWYTRLLGRQAIAYNYPFRRCPVCQYSATK